MISIDKGIWESRKELWRDIEFRLSFDKEHSKAELKVFQAYFVKGKEPNLHPMEKDPIPLVYRLWLAPDQSVESWINITQRFLAGPEQWITKFNVAADGSGESWEEVLSKPRIAWQISKSLDETYDILMKRTTAEFLNGHTPFQGTDIVPPLGFMGGAERKLLDFLSGLTPGSERFTYRGGRLFTPSSYFGHMYYRDRCLWLDAFRYTQVRRGHEVSY